MLVSMPVFEVLVEELQADAGGRASTVQPASDSEDLRRKINCPQCHRPMDAHFYAGPGNVVIDSCEECCLIWLDRGELMRIVHASDGTISYAEPLSGDDPGLQPAQDWNSLGKMAVGDIIIDGIGDSFFK
jgi:Zn-finger nucleic acid-binding protein